jgi:predicted Zn-dependent protease
MTLSWRNKLCAAAVMLVISEVLILNAAGAFMSEGLSYQAKELTDRDKLSNARIAAAAAVRQNPRNPYAIFHLAVIDLLDRKYQDAARRFDEAEPLLPHISNLLRLRAQANFHNGEFEQAARDLDLYFEVNPESKVTPGFLHRIAGESHFQLRNYGSATAQLLDAADYKDSRADAVRIDISARTYAFQPESGLFCLLALKTLGLERHFNAADVLKNGVIAKREQATQDFFTLVRQTGNSTPAWDKIGAAAAAKAGKLDEAVTLLKQLHAAQPNDAEILLMIGDLLHEKQDKTGAATYYEQYLKAVPDSPLRDQLRQRISSTE